MEQTALGSYIFMLLYNILVQFSCSGVHYVKGHLRCGKTLPILIRIVFLLVKWMSCLNVS